MIQTATLTQPLVNLSAFCATRPHPDEVKAFLRPLGFTLEFSMPATVYTTRRKPRSLVPAIPILPAQYHYRDRYGTEIIFLAGKDASWQIGGTYPRHESRWWLYHGSSQYSYNFVKQELSAKWRLQWTPFTQMSDNS